jgi:hypothetical protein
MTGGMKMAKAKKLAKVKKLAPAKQLEKEITLSRTGGGSTGIPNQS